MIELLLTIGSGKVMPSFPDSGPGPKTLTVGTAQAGYFGTVSATELFTQQSLDAAISAPGTITPITNGFTFLWHKFVYKGKFLFIPNFPLKSGVTWAEVYSAGLLYGTDNDGLYQPTGLPTKNQFTTVSRSSQSEGKTFNYIVRTLTGYFADPATGTPTQATAGSNEFSDLFQLVPGLVNTSTNVSNYRFNDQHLTVNTVSSNPANLFIQRAYSLATPPAQTLTSSNKYSTRVVFRPVLELIPTDTIAFGPRGLYSLYTANLPPYGLTNQYLDQVRGPVNLMATQADMKQPLLLNYEIV